MCASRIAGQRYQTGTVIRCSLSRHNGSVYGCMTSVDVGMEVNVNVLYNGAPSKLIRSEDRCSTIQYSCCKVEVLYDELSRFATIGTVLLRMFMFCDGSMEK